MWISAAELYKAGISSREINKAIKEDLIGSRVIGKRGKPEKKINKCGTRIRVRDGQLKTKDGQDVELFVPSLPHFWQAAYWRSQALYWREMASR